MPITLPEKPHVVTKDGFRAVIEIEGLYPGYGMTLGNALRRVLLSSLEGAATTMVKIKGVSHEFSTISGVMEDVVQILLNIKRLRFIKHTNEPEVVTISVHGEREVTAADIKGSSQIQVVDPTAHIATLTDKKSEFEVELTIEKGFGYVPVEEKKREKTEIGAAALDAIFTPIRKINYEVENMRVGERTDYDRLRFIIETDGTIDPEEAFMKGARILVDQFAKLISFDETAAQDEEEVKEHVAEDVPVAGGIAELGLPARTTHALEAAGITSIDDLTQKTEAELLELEGMGAKMITDIKKALKKSNMDLKEE
ncbi:MAG: DNA-directed RNA polymerase subunit alpha [Candidatus Azambacteria bacterium]|nr:DNA-directed RNA polymerase subunit alpha [Candidatus Azambacteria bacterium]